MTIVETPPCKDPLRALAERTALVDRMVEQSAGDLLWPALPSGLALLAVGGYLLLYCPHNRAGLITSTGEAEGQILDVVISPVDEKQFRKTVVSVLLNNALRDSMQMDRLLETRVAKGKIGSS